MEAESAVGSLLMKLGGLLADECARLKGVQGEVLSLQSELKSMYALLQKCATREKLDVQVKAWTKEVRELVYDFEDGVNMFVHEIGTEEHPGGIKGFFSSILHRLKTLGTRHNIAEKIQELKSRVIEVGEQRERYMFDDGSTSSSNDQAIDIDPRLSAIFAEQADLVGIDAPRDELVRRLVEGKARHMKRCMVLSIFGIGGLGKTTLAHEVRRKIGNQFDCQAYASVSQTVDLKKILLVILSGVTKNDNNESVKVGETWDEERLIEKTRELLYQKRYLVIIDDIWSKAAWDLLKCALPENNNGELKCLETIVLRNYSWELPRGLTRLKHLRHLHVHEDGKLPEGIGALLALQRLSKFNICDSPVSAVQELGNLKNLKELCILWEQDEPSDERYKEYFSSSLVKLSSYGLRSLSIFSRRRSTSVEFLESLSHPPYLLREFWMRNTYFQKCPKWIAPLNRLTVLKLDVWELEDADMRLLGELPALLYFVLWVVALRKQRIVIKGTGFQSLNAFHLWSGLPCLTFEERSMPKLKTLKLSFSACEAESYGSTHSGIEHLQNLRNVEVGISKVDASGSSIEVAEREIRHAIAKHPDNPKINILYYTWAFGRC
ncbi:hypothetical protein PR202_ga22074 [Eleusine coracana subsp. coracana]|uniref:Uncharacterized protein n=1 Tax=Eleusine coracana subsp. coracana TaxID=191504 RepID=A0AAV5D232_ELECO|nr:hypothetical protein PR202_ga22074 [Eleusine coracana subsp. coracana]